MSAAIDSAPGPLTADELEQLAEALDSHLYWQVNEDETRRRDGYVMEPYTDEEQAVIDLTARVYLLRKKGLAEVQ